MAANAIQWPVLPLQLEGSTVDGRTIVRCSGKLIAGTAEFFRTEAGRWIERSKIVAVDLDDLTHLDSSGLRALLGVANLAQKAKCDFRVLNATPRVMDLLNFTSLAGE
jgi:anti-anti-sigma factor